ARRWWFCGVKAQRPLRYVRGETLGTVSGRSLPRLVQVVAHVADGMVQMHRRGVCHADLKPNNIMLTKTGEVKVIDYGLAWIKGEKKGRVQGTPEYMAPEQARQGTVNERTDIYNLGATMYRLVTFRHPPPTHVTTDGIKVDAKTFENLLKPVAELNPQCPPALAELIHK